MGCNIVYAVFMRNLGVVLVLLVLGSGCYELDHLLRPAYKPPATPATTAVASTSKPVNSQKAHDERRKAMEKRAWAAVVRDGHPDGKKIADKIADCFLYDEGPRNPLQPTPGRCEQLAQKLEEQSSAAVFAGMALGGFWRNPDAAEKFVKLAEEAAQDGAKRAAAARTKDRKKEEENEAVDALVKTCWDKRTICADRCLKGDMFACVAEGMVAWQKEGDPDDARLIFARACREGLDAGCRMGVALESIEKDAQKKRDAAWSSVENSVDQIAQKKFLMAFPRNARTTQMMAQHVASLIKDDYCPAKKEFVAITGPAEFAKRSKNHCDTEPPRATGLAGKEVELKAECRSVYASACP